MNHEKFIIKETEVQKGRVDYIARNDDGEEIRGCFTERSGGRNRILTQNALEQMADQLIGTEVKVDSDQIRQIGVGQHEGFSIGGAFDE